MEARRKIFSKNKPSRLLAVLTVACLVIYGVWVFASGLWVEIAERLH